MIRSRMNLLSLLMVAALLFGTSLGMTSPHTYASSPIAQFTDDFSQGIGLWQPLQGPWLAEDGVLRNYSTTTSSIEPKGDAAQWSDQALTVRLKLDEMNAGGYIGLYFRYSGATDYAMLLVRSTAIHYKLGSASEQNLFGYSFALNTEYDIRIEALGSEASVEVKRADDNEYVSAGTFDLGSTQTGKVRLGAYGAKASFEGVQVDNLQDASFLADTDVLQRLETGQTTALSVQNMTGQPVVWSSGDEAVATVDGFGAVTGHRSGHTSVTATVYGGSEAAAFDIYVVDPISQPGILQFSDDFDNWMYRWQTIGGNAKVVSGRLTLPGSGVNTVEIRGDSSVWDNQTVTLTFRLAANAPAGAFAGVDLRFNSASDRTLLLIRPTGIGGKIGSDPEKKLADYAFLPDTDYELKIEALGDTANVFIRESGQLEDQFIGSLINLPEHAGRFQLLNNKLSISFDDIHIRNNNESDFALGDKVVAMAAGGTAQPTLVNTTGQQANWSSDNNAVATVDSFGTIAGLAKGMAKIETATVDDSHRDSVTVVVYEPVSGIHLNKTVFTLTVGEHENVTAAIEPGDADNRSTVWSTSDAAVVDFYGESDGARAIRALSPGTAEITVSTPDGAYAASADVTVTAADTASVGSVTFSVYGTTELPPGILGVHNEQLFSIGKKTDFNPLSYQDLAEDLHVQNIRGPGGTSANYYLYEEGKLLNSSDSRYASYYGTATVNAVESTNLVPGYPSFTLGDGYSLSNELGVPYVFDLNVISQSVTETSAQIEAMSDETDQPLFVEMGNELYASTYDFPFPTVDDYIAKCKQIYAAIKAIDPSIQVGIVAVDQNLENRILSDPANQPDPGVDWGSTIAGRIAAWNSTLAEDNSFYDAVIVHVYTPVNSFDDLPTNKFINYLYTFNESVLENYAVLEQRFSGKPLWVTEWSVLPSVVLKEQDAREKARLQFMKTPALAIHQMERILQMIESGAVTISDIHALVDPQGFGLAQPAVAGDDSELALLPGFYTFAEMGELLDGNSQFYKLNMDQGNTFTGQLLFTNESNAQYSVAEAGAWGFGDETGLKQIVLANRTSHPIDASVNGLQLRSLWSYGGSDPLPDYLTNPNDKWTDAPTVNPLPMTFDSNALFENQIQLEPYSMTVVEVSAASGS